MSFRAAVARTLAALTVGLGAAAYGQHQHGGPAAAPAPAPAPAGKAPIRVTEQQMHHGPGGVPMGWRFSWPDGDPRKGREVFAKLECYQCHEVPDQGFPTVKPDPTRRGPALAGMGAMHPPEYFAESILNPNAVILTEPGYTGPDGLSIMPDYRDSLTLAETVDLVAFIRSLTGGGHHGHHQHGAATREQMAAGYRVRLDYADGQDHAHHADGGHQHGAPAKTGAAAKPTAHLMVFVSDEASGEPVPYLPVTATIQAEKAPPQVVKLRPMFGDRGFHYGTNVLMPAKTTKITVAIGKPFIAVMPSSSRPARAATSVTFEWSR